MNDDMSGDTSRLEDQIKDTQDRIGDTVSELGDRLSPGTAVKSFLAGEGGTASRWTATLTDNLPALALIGGGALWLWSNRPKSAPSRSPRRTDHHRAFVDHMSSIDQRDGEDETSYHRRRDTARANFMMLDRRHDEDEQGFRERLDDATSMLREKTRAFGDYASDKADQAGDVWNDATSYTSDSARNAGRWAKRFYANNPVAAGLVVAAVGAGMAAFIPRSDVEDDHLGGLGGQVRAAAKDRTQALIGDASDKIDDIARP